MTTVSRNTAGRGGNDLASLLADGLDQLGLPLSAAQQAGLLEYQSMLAKWNGVYNLTAIRDPRQMMIQHVLDSLAILPRLNPEPITRILDVGSGGGLPGMILAIARPDWQITVNDIVHKKTAFLKQAKGALKLDNVTVITGRVEQLVIGEEVSAPFDGIVSRAFADLSDFVGLARHLLTPTGNIWAMKGVAPEDEIHRLPADCELLERLRLHVPFLDAERHLLRVKVGA